MMRASRTLFWVGLAAIVLAMALVLAGCDDETVADAAARGAGTGDLAPTASAEPAASSEPVQAEDITGAADGELTIVATSIDRILEEPEHLTGREVTVEGIILTQCIRGCQFSLDDGTGVIGIELVDEALENVLMTGSVGRTVEVRGKLETGSRPLILVEDRDGWSYTD